MLSHAVFLGSYDLLLTTIEIIITRYYLLRCLIELVALKRYTPEYEIVHCDIEHGQKHVRGDEQFGPEGSWFPYLIVMNA